MTRGSRNLHRAPPIRSCSLHAALVALLTSMASGAQAAPGFSFTDVTVDVGLHHSRAEAPPEACEDGRNCALSWAGSVAAEDVDGDGDVDLYFTMDAGPGVLYQNRAGHFVDVTAEAGLDGAPVGGGVSLVDIDGDGDRDLLINPISTLSHPATRPSLYLSDGSTRSPGSVPAFVEVGAARGLTVPRRNGISGMGMAIGDYDLDGSLDVYFADWHDRVFVCDGAGARLFRGLRGAPGYFSHASLGAGVWASSIGTAVRGYSFGGVFSDLDRDGLPDLLVTSDAASSELYWGRVDGTFEAGGAAAGVATDQTGMGSTLADYDNDGDLDLFVSAIQSSQPWWDGNRLYRHDGPRTFSDQTDAAGVRDAGWAWGAVFADLDDDGDVDLVVTSGAKQSSTTPAGYADTETKVFLNPLGPGVWEDVSEAVGVRGLRLGREVVALDYDADGDQDLLVVPHVGPPALLRNDPSASRDWLEVRVVGAPPALEAIGALIEARASNGTVQVREVGTRTHFTGHGPRIEHFGFGPGFFAGGGSVALRVTFLDGGELAPVAVTASGSVTLSRADASVATRAALPIPAPRDCDADDLPDHCLMDCDLNAEPDVCQLRAHPDADCDADAVIDSCAIGLGLVPDCDSDGVPDACDVAPACSVLDQGWPDLGPSDAALASDLGAPLDVGERSDLGSPVADQASVPADAHGLDSGSREPPPGFTRGGAGCAAQGSAGERGEPGSRGAVPFALWVMVVVLCVRLSRRCPSSPAAALGGRRLPRGPR